ncbi:DUF4350 domain-containing protein [Dyadobacter psychrotolerans]|uniref:DUF4350 domain-containing protein n=1 Tax=Dyadobacter psychrotolerans TaxID=2541721 RepID=A0A4R5DMN6_9BACT|nr:DUF4350 domain-containing protein [Dyadobacter psychrotolerans]TDE11953.1 DUF4350 domain-containing protein [Dyadobacter psychrotolerans]
MFFNLNRYWLFLFLIVLGYGLFEYYRPKPVDWKESYSNEDKIPFGTEVLFDLMPELVGGHNVESVRIPPYNWLAEDSADKAKSSYIFIKSLFQIDANDRKALLDYVKKGNVVFISAYRFSGDFLKDIGVKAPQHGPSLRDSAKVFNFVNPLLRDKKGFKFSKDDGTNYLQIKKGTDAVVLAVNEDNEPVFVKVTYGKGQIYIHNLALAFTNYYVLDSLTSQHAFKAISYLPKQPVYWDEYQKKGRFGENQHSVFRYIVTSPGLKTAYYLALSGLLLYVIFSGKRRQRVIPIMNSPKNVSLEFVKTIGNMYYRKGNHANMAGKLVQHFRMYLRERFGVNTATHSDEELSALISQKGGLSNLETEDLLREISDEHGKWTGERLIELNHKLEEFYERTR